jgi:hypothetical protein
MLSKVIAMTYIDTTDEERAQQSNSEKNQHPDSKTVRPSHKRLDPRIVALRLRIALAIITDRTRANAVTVAKLGVIATALSLAAAVVQRAGCPSRSSEKEALRVTIVQAAPDLSGGT